VGLKDNMGRAFDCQLRGRKSIPKIVCFDYSFSLLEKQAGLIVCFQKRILCRLKKISGEKKQLK
jgi:hypothetical protein